MTPKGPVWRRMLARGRVATGLVTDQALSSGGNFVVGVLAARALGPEGFGFFALAISFWLVVMAVARASLVQPLIVRWRSVGHDRREVEAAILTVSLLAGIALAAISGGAGLIIRGEIGSVLIGLAVALPWLQAQDSLRAWLLSQKRPWLAATSDGLWAIASIGLILFIADSLTSGVAVAIWGFGAAVGLVPLLVVLRTCPTIASVRLWARLSGRASAGFLGSQSAAVAVTQGVSWVVAFVLSPAALGGFRAIQNLLVPGKLLSMATEYFFLGQLADAVDRVAATRRILLVNLALVGGWGGLLVVLYLADLRLVTIVFGPDFTAYEWLVVPLAASSVITAATGVFLLLLRSRLAVGALARLTGTTGVARLIAVFVGGIFAGLPGLVVGLILGDLAHLVNAWGTARRHEVTPTTELGA